jgi:dipeptidyl aminopeptidase/acylaminoacyl peptidase
MAVNRVNKQNYKVETLHELEDVDIDSIVVDKQSNRLLFATANNHSTEFIAFDKRFAFLQNWYKDELSKTIMVLNGSDNGNKFILESSDLFGRQQWLVDTPTQQITPLEKQILPGKQSRVGSYQAIEIPSDNGIPIQAFLARPSFIAPDLKIPTVVYIHGGPRVRAYPKYAPDISFLTNRGYAVLVVNYYGSTGYGKNYMQLPVGDYASLPNSISAAVDWLIDSGSADPAKIALMGGSYGGYLSLLMPSLDSRFACSIAINSVTDLYRMAIFDREKYDEESFSRTTLAKYHGDDLNSNYESWSPINQTDYKRNAVLMVHAEDDRTVPIEQSTEFYKKFKSTNSIRFITLANESHGLQRWTSRLRILRESEKFLAQCLGGPKGGFDYYSIVEPLSRIYYLF